MAAQHGGRMAVVGLNNTKIIPAGWEAHHRPVPVGAMTGICVVREADLPGEYPDFTATPGRPLSKQVPCRVQQLQREGRANTVGGMTDTRGYQITIPLDTWPVGVEVTDTGPIVTVTGYQAGHDGDPDLIGRALRVTNMQRGTLAWERVLYCTDDLSEGTP